MLLITDELNDGILAEQTVKEDGSKELYISGIFLQQEIKNGNGRIYPASVMEKAAMQYKSKYIDTRRGLGELNHPKHPQVNPERASHLMVELNQQGNDWYGKARVLDTPMGNIVRGIIEGGGSLGVSSRGLGSVKTNRMGINEVQDDLVFTAIDTVTDPSAPSAFVNGIMEGITFNAVGDEITEEKVEVIKQFLRFKKKKLTTEEELNLFNSFIDSIKG